MQQLLLPTEKVAVSIYGSESGFHDQGLSHFSSSFSCQSNMLRRNIRSSGILRSVDW